MNMPQITSSLTEVNMASEDPPEEDFPSDLVSVDVGTTVLSGGHSLVLDVFNRSPRDLEILEFDYLMSGVFALSFPTLPESDTRRTIRLFGRVSGESLLCGPQRHLTRLIPLRAVIPSSIDIKDGAGVVVGWSYRLRLIGLSGAKTFEGQVVLRDVALAYTAPKSDEKANNPDSINSEDKG